ncbi:MAG: peptidase [Sphingomonas bacterium]|uniref:M20/M25/M40 family metallo-hydrolase n=1 Tax=Sphingomonas bacterium TaxID=1895847 RepID=UPI00262271D0|nr:M20/M25/M40 family metallo-hydrolase [Sphingomonas bacterium]MDB5707338.1 peptidase [Sphingomonas bacterium]
MPNSLRIDRRLSPALALAAMLAAAPAQAAPADASQARFRALYQELIETDTSLSNGSCTLAAERMKARLVAAGYAPDQFRIVVPPQFAKQGSLVGEIIGSDARAPAVLLLAHIDVVEAKRSDWKRDPFKLVEENGYFYARGAIDDKAMAASYVDALVRYREEGFKPRRAIKLALTCGEETDAHFDGVQYLLAHEPDTLKAGFAINEGGKGTLDAAGKPISFGVQTGEKIYQDFTLTTTAPGGHSARPTDDNAIVRLGDALSRISHYKFPVDVTEGSKSFFTQSAPSFSGQTRDDMIAVGAGTAEAATYARIAGQSPYWNAFIRTTCIATLIEGGHASNAQPQHAQANVNCRIMPGEKIPDIQLQLAEQIADPKVELKLAEAPGPQSPAPPLTPAIMKPIEKIAAEMWPGVPVVPILSTGATDGRFLMAAGIPTYGVSGVFVDPDGNGVHGLDERVRVTSLYDAREFLYRLIKTYGAAR